MKLLMLDMDGTLFTDDKRITEKTMDCLINVKKRGVKIGIATGRASFNVKSVLKKYQLENIVDYIVGLNGAQVEDIHNHILLQQDCVSSDMARDVYSKIQHTDINLVSYTSNGVYARYDEERVHKLCRNLSLSLSLYDFSSGDLEWNKLLCLRKYPYTEEECSYLLSLNNEQYHGFITDVDCFEIVNTNVSKSKGIQVLCNLIGISIDDVMAFGDSGNDVDMLANVGIGVSMGNATDVVKSVAKFVTLSNEEDGIDYFVEKYL